MPVTPSLSSVRWPLITPIRPGTNWIAVVNPKAGGFEAPKLYAQVKDQVGQGMIRYETNPDPEARIQEMSRLIANQRPSLSKPLGILAMGGDRTINDCLSAVLDHIFGDLSELTERSADRVVDQMLESGIQIGAVCLGGANDIGTNYGAPRNRVEDVMAYLDDARLVCLNMGMAFLAGDPNPHLFCHSMSCGPTLASSFEQTKDERGKAAELHRARIGMANILKHRPVVARWRDGEGISHERPVLEVLSHASVRVAEYNGFPGTPQPGGLGIIVFPGESRWNTLKLFVEVISRGVSSRRGNPRRLLPSERLTTFTDPSLQIALPVGGERTFFFHDSQGDVVEVPVGGNGDHIRRSPSVTFRALPPFPNFMVRDGSLMANIYRSMG